MTTAVIVQARMGSTRLPGKVMHELAGRPVLEHVLRRCLAIQGVDLVILAVPDEGASISMIDLARRLHVPVFSGPEKDVLERYRGAMVWANNVVARNKITTVVRITADCPLIDPDVCARVVALRHKQHAIYTSNVHPRSFPHGLDCEAFTADALINAADMATDPADREHVTPWVVRNAKRVNVASGCFDLKWHRWTLDYPEDLEFMRALFRYGDPKSMDDVLGILEDHPEICDINANRKVAA